MCRCWYCVSKRTNIFTVSVSVFDEFSVSFRHTCASMRLHDDSFRALCHRSLYGGVKNTVHAIVHSTLSSSSATQSNVWKAAKWAHGKWNLINALTHIFIFNMWQAIAHRQQHSWCTTWRHEPAARDYKLWHTCILNRVEISERMRKRREGGRECDRENCEKQRGRHLPSIGAIPIQLSSWKTKTIPTQIDHMN